MSLAGARGAPLWLAGLRRFRPNAIIAPDFPEHPLLDNNAALEGDFATADIAALAARGAIAQLSVTQRTTPLTDPIARGLAPLASVDYFWLWCTTTRAALRHVFALPRLRELHLSGIAAPGRLRGVADAAHLQVFRSSWMTETDLLELSRSRTLVELGVRGSKITPRVIEAFVAMPKLASLDVEDTHFDDAMARQLSVSTAITALWVGQTRLTRDGLAALCRMRQLRSLDLWMTRITVEDLALLATLPNLESLTLGSYDGDPDALRGAEIVPALRKIKSLKTLWLDGVALNPSTRRAIEKRYTNVRIS